MELPPHSFHVSRYGKRAHLRVKNLPMPDTFFYSNNVSVAGEISVNVRWEAIGNPVRRGNGLDHGDNLWDKFIGDFADARCYGHAKCAETGFKAKTDTLTQEGFYASMGYERNGKYLSTLSTSG